MMNSSSKNYAYATLLTRSSYLAGVLVLAFSLRKQGSRFPLVIMYTNGLGDPARNLLEILQNNLNIILSRVVPLKPRAGQCSSPIAERFVDTWTKLWVFQLFDYEKICFLDADMVVFKPIDQLLDVQLPGGDWLAAAPVCCCNLDKDAWAPEDWIPENCPYTHQRHSDVWDQVARKAPDRPRPATYELLNGGMFVFHPSLDQWNKLQNFFNTSPLLASFKFPDQDFLAVFFSDKWLYVGWQYNALKTMRYWHINLWRDEDVACLHYIVDKPWATRIGQDGLAGYIGKDGETHKWWWSVFEEFISDNNIGTVLDQKGFDTIKQHVAEEDVGNQPNQSDVEFGLIGAKVQAYASSYSDVN